MGKFTRRVDITGNDGGQSVASLLPRQPCHEDGIGLVTPGGHIYHPVDVEHHHHFLALGMEGILETWTCVADRIAFLLPWELPYGPLLWALSAGVVGAAAGHGLGLGRERTVLLSVLAILCGLLFRQS